MGNTFKIKSDVIGSNLVHTGKFIDINTIKSLDVLNVNKTCSYDTPTKTTQTDSVSQSKSDGEK